MINIILENGERARVYYGLYEENGQYFCEVVLVSEEDTYRKSVGPIDDERRARNLFDILKKNVALPMNIEGIYEDSEY